MLMSRVTGKWPFSQRLSSVMAIFIIVATVGGLYLWRLGTLTPGLSENEISARDESASFSNIASDPLYAPHRVMQHILQLVGESGAFWMRLVSVVTALFLIYLFYILLKLWFGRFISILGTLLLISTPYMILSARSASPHVMLLLPIATLSVFYWFSHTQRKNLAWIALIFLIAASFYIPGGVYFIIAASFLLLRPLLDNIRQINVYGRIAGLVLLSGLVLPICLSVLKSPAVANEFLLIPKSSGNVGQSFSSIGWSISALVWRAEENFPLIMGRLPILSSAQIILSSFGVYALWNHARRQLYLALVAIIIGTAGAGLNNDPSLLMWCLPPFAIFAAAGLRYLYKEWRRVFPLNPIPRALAVFLLLSVVSVHLLYGIRYALIAWPQTVDTKNSYMLK